MTNYTALLIDDEYASWMPALEPVAAAHGVTLHAAESVEEGLRLLSEHENLFDAVLLDLAFPQGQMQGGDALPQIVGRVGAPPVLVLTASAGEEDLRTAVECVRRGAYDYFPKSRLDPVQLFLQVQNAARQARRDRRLVRRGEQARDGHAGPFVFVEESAEGGVARFGYRLDSVVTPRSEGELGPAMHSAMEWTQNLIDVLAYEEHGSQFCLRYLSEPHAEMLAVYFLVRAASTSRETAARSAQSLGNELAHHLCAYDPSGPLPYYFEPVCDEAVLLRALEPFPRAYGVTFGRRTLAAPGTSALGFAAGPAPAAHAAFRFPVSQPGSGSVRTLELVCRRLLEQHDATMLDAVLSPATLALEEASAIQSFLRSPALNTAGLAPEETGMTEASLGALLDGPSVKVTVSLWTAGDSISHTLRVAAMAGLGAAEFHAARTDGDGMGKGVGERLPLLYARRDAASVFRLPLPVPSGLPGIRGTHPSRDYVPRQLPDEGPLLGAKWTYGQLHPVRIRPEDLRRHVYILGQTGTGKTTLLKSMLLERIGAGVGVALIDPHGDLADEIVKSLPESRRDDVVFFDPSDLQQPHRLNLLEYDRRLPEQQSFLIDQLFGLLRQEYHSDTMGPMFELYARNALLLVMDVPVANLVSTEREARPGEDKPQIDVGSDGASDPPRVESGPTGTLLDVVRVFEDSQYRDRLVQLCNNEEVKRFWLHGDGMRGESAIQNMSTWITSKLNRFTQNHFVRALCNEPESTVDFRQIIDEGRIFIARLPKGRLSAGGVQMIGTVLFSRFLMAALSREDIPEPQRADFVLFVDEFQSFTSHDSMALLSEARKYRLSLVLANQTLAQLSQEIAFSVLGNVGSLVFFRPGVQDYARVRPYLSPPFEDQEILGLPNFSAFARLLVNNAPTRPFLFNTLRPEGRDEN